MSATAQVHTAAPRLERLDRGRVLAGVCVGLGRHLRIDPTLVRIVFIVLAIVGGTGFVAYGLAWLVIPDEGESAPLIRRIRGRRLTTFAGVALLIAGAAATFNALIGDGVGHLVAWSVVLLGLGGWLVSGPLDRVYAPGDTAPVTSETVVVAPAGKSHRATRIVGGAMLLGAGAVTLIAASGVDLSGQEVAGVAVVAAGVALAIGAFFGASPWLAIPPLVVAASVAALAAAGVALHGPVGERTFSPVAASQLSGTYRVAIGQGNLDLRHTALPIGTTHVKLRVGIGEAVVRVPAGVMVTVHGHSGVGRVQMPNGHTDGTDVDRTVRFAGTGGSALDVDADVGIGQVRVLREEPVR